MTHAYARPHQRNGPGELDGSGLEDAEPDERHVLTGRPLRPGHRLQDATRFDEDVWDVTPALFQQHVGRLVLDFAPVPNPYRLAIKQLCLAMLSGDLPANETRPSVSSIRRHLLELRRFTDWLAIHANTDPQDWLRLARLTPDDLAAYGSHLRTVLRSPASREVAEVSIRLLWRYRTVLPDDRLTVDPLDADSWGSSRRRSHGENTTTRIPEEVIGPLLIWSLRFVDDFSGDIITALTDWRAVVTPPDRSIISPHDVTPRLLAVLDDYRRTGLPLPGHRGAVNYTALARQVGCAHSTLHIHRLRPHIEATAAANGITNSPALPTTINGRLDGELWLPHIGASTHGRNDAMALARLLQTASYATIAYLSGMRDSELKHLRRGCVRVHRDSTGTPYRTTATSIAFKGEADPAGATATWIIGAAAARAVDVLERLQPPDTELLFRPITADLSDRLTRDAQDVSRTNELLNTFVGWINTYCRDHGRTDTIPTGQRLHTRQFRRTLAWHIARRPGGSIAGAIQYRHLSIQMFEGYAGTSDSGFRAEVEAEEALHRGEHLLTSITGHDHGGLTGPAAAEATRRLSAFTAAAGFTGTVITDPARLKRVMRRHDPHIYPSTYATCVFDPAKAMCQPRPDNHGIARPSQSACQPLDCRNIALTAANRDALYAETARLDTALTQRPALPPLLANQLTARRDKITAFLARHTPAETP